jgi:hypothetical protein
MSGHELTIPKTIAEAVYHLCKKLGAGKLEINEMKVFYDREIVSSIEITYSLPHFP